VLPQDNHEIFSPLTDEERKTRLASVPAEVLEEYNKDGKPDVAGKVFERSLRNYTLMFNNVRQRKTVLFDEAEATKRDMALVVESRDDAQRQVQFYQNLNTDMGIRLAKAEKERDAVAKLLKQITDKLATIEGNVKRLIEENTAMAGQIAEKQLEATRLIDARTRVMAQTAHGGEK
jgi:vacuolar-type H+-ATPase subunit I/STV1